MNLEIVSNPQAGKADHKVAALVPSDEQGHFVATDNQYGREWVTSRLYLVLHPAGVAAIETGMHLPSDYVRPGSGQDTFRPRSYVSLVVAMDPEAENFVVVRSAVEHSAAAVGE